MDTSYDRLVLANEIVAKALALPEVTQMAKAEQLLRQYLDKKWEIRVNQAVTAAKKATAAGKSAKQIQASIRKIMKQWSKDVTPRFNRDVEKVYKLARVVAAKKAKKKTKKPLVFDTPNFQELKPVKKATTASVGVSFDLADQEAIAMLQERNVFWIGSHYDENVAGAIASTTSETLGEVGATRRVAALLMAERVREQLGRVVTPGGFHGTSVQYFEGLTANSMTVARVFGQMRSFDDIGITRYTIVNPQDSRTCKVCSTMDGKVFTVQQGAAQMAAEQAATSPDQIKAIHPWLSTSQLAAITTTPGRVSGPAGRAESRALSAAGVSLPPFHFRCRCTVDVDPAAGSFEQLA
ncbi:MAG: hypothetical protein ACWGQW_03965 [bacterium]